MLQAVSFAAERFLRAGRWLDAADDVMARLGQAAVASRVYLFANRVDGEGVLRACQIAEWSADGIEPQMESPELQDPPYDESGFGRWAELLARGDSVEGLVNEFPADEQDLLHSQGIRSVVVMPVFVHDDWWGFFGIDECRRDRRWTVSEREALRTAANTLGAAVQRDLAEQALREREAHYRRLVHMSPYPIFALDTAGRVTELNQAGEAMLGMSSVLVLGRPVTNLMTDEDRPKARAVFDRLMTEGSGTIEFESAIQTPAGELRQLHVAATAMWDDDALVGLQGIARDITDERGRELQLRRAERLASLGTLIGGVAHELNNPMTSIRGLAELLLEGTDSESQREMLETVLREADRTARIVDDLRLLARRTQEGEGVGESVDVNDVVRHVLKLRGYSLESHDIDLEVRLEPGLPRVLGDAGQLEQVVLNLLVNAEQALESGAEVRRIRVSTRGVVSSQGGGVETSGEWVRLSLADTGPGIAAADQARLFDPFWTTKDPAQGTGLGLSLVHKIVTEHGGRVEVDSHPGEGARFTVVLPASAERTDEFDAVAASAGNVAEAASAGGSEVRSDVQPLLAAKGPAVGPLRILVVDDEEAIRRILEVALTRQGHEVVLAENGIEALALAEELQRSGGEIYDLVLSDLRMAGLSGEQLLQRLEPLDSSYRRRMIFMTGDVHAVQAGTVRTGKVPLVRKPFRLEEMVELVHDLATRGSE